MEVEETLPQTPIRVNAKKGLTKSDEVGNM
jgi:hypothetical protein